MEKPGFNFAATIAGSWNGITSSRFENQQAPVGGGSLGDAAPNVRLHARTSFFAHMSNPYRQQSDVERLLLPITENQRRFDGYGDETNILCKLRALRRRPHRLGDARDPACMLLTSVKYKRYASKG